MSKKRIVAMNKTMLAEAYGISVQTLNKWLNLIPGLNMQKGQRLFTPKQLHLIIEHLGKWE